MKVDSNQLKSALSGDYYQVSKNGVYQRHRNVTVHCYGNQQSQKKLGASRNEPQMKNSNVSINLSSQASIMTPKYDQRKSCESGFRSPFLQDCKKILQKEQVNSIHEQDPQQMKITPNKVNLTSEKNLMISEKRDKNSKMRRSSQHLTNPKKGILKRSMLDKNQQGSAQNYTDKNNEKNFKIDRSVRIANIQINNNKQQNRQDLIKEQYQIAAHRYRSSQSIDNQSIPSRQYVFNKRVLQTARQISLNQHQNPDNYLTSRVTNKNNSNLINLISSNRVHTEGKQTVAVAKKYNKQLNDHDQDFSNTNQNVQSAVQQQINFLKQRFIRLESELKQSQMRRRKIQLQMQLKNKQVQIQRIKKQNQFLKYNNFPYQNTYHHHNSGVCNRQQPASKKQQKSFNFQDFESWIRLAEEKSTFIISFLITLLACVMLGKSSSTCNK